MMNIIDGSSKSFTEGEVFREELIGRMKAASSKKNIFLTAPGGYGKTTAAAQWLGLLRKKTEKIVVRDSDNDAGVFYKRLATPLLALAGKRKDTPRSSVNLDGLLKIIDNLPKRNARCYLIIDDLHILKNDEMIRHLPALAKRLPFWVSLCLISRSEPSSALLETGLFEVFTREDFLFTPKEVEYLGTEKERNLTAC